MPKEAKGERQARQEEWTKQELDDFIKDGLPILPELQFANKPPLDTLSPELRRRIELVLRAYSAALYAHKNKINYLQKESILSALKAECCSVLTQVSEIVLMTKKSPAAERCALLNDYQSWANQVCDLLKEALYALDYEKWKKQLIDVITGYNPKLLQEAQEAFETDDWEQRLKCIISSGDALCRKDGRLQLSKTFLNVLALRSKVFEEDKYISKFLDLLYLQLQLEGRLGLTIEITGEWVKDYLAKLKESSAATGGTAGDIASQEWSKPMSKAEMMQALGIDDIKKFNKWAAQYGIKKLGQKTFQIRLDNMDKRSRQKLDPDKI